MSDAKRLAARKARFAPQLADAAAVKARKERVVKRLRAKVQVLIDAERAGKLRYVVGSSAQKLDECHQIADPEAVFKDLLLNAPWARTEAAVQGTKLVVTLQDGKGNTVTGSCENGLVTIFHAGRTAGGVGYGINLGTVT